MNKVRSRRVSRGAIVEMIDNSKGKIFTVTFTKNNGTERSINCNYKRPMRGNNLGYLNVYSMKDFGYRNVNTRTITALKMNGVTYKVR